MDMITKEKMDDEKRKWIVREKHSTLIISNHKAFTRYNGRARQKRNFTMPQQISVNFKHNPLAIVTNRTFHRPAQRHDQTKN
jgi:hypothetical protein